MSISMLVLTLSCIHIAFGVHFQDDGLNDEGDEYALELPKTSCTPSSEAGKPADCCNEPAAYDPRGNLIAYTKAEDFIAAGIIQKTATMRCRGLIAMTEAYVETQAEAKYKKTQEGQQWLKEVPQDDCKAVMLATLYGGSNFDAEMKDKIRCTLVPPEDSKGNCEKSMLWKEKMRVGTKMWAEEKGRTKEGAPTDVIVKVSDNGGISNEHFGCNVDPLKQVFSEPVVHARGIFIINEPTEVAQSFLACGVPFVGGLSGSLGLIATHVYGAGKTNALDDQTLFQLMATLAIGGHHSFVETAIVACEFVQNLDTTNDHAAFAKVCEALPFKSDEYCANLAAYKKSQMADHTKYVNFLKALTTSAAQVFGFGSDVAKQVLGLLDTAPTKASHKGSPEELVGGDNS